MDWCNVNAYKAVRQVVIVVIRLTVIVVGMIFKTFMMLVASGC